MSKMTTYIIRIHAFVLALLVFMLSSGFTYHWQVCTHANADPMCVIIDQTCCCLETTQTSACLCSDVGDKTCNLTFSEYIQFNFETQLSEPLELRPKLTGELQAPLCFSAKECLLQKTIFLHYKLLIF